MTSNAIQGARRRWLLGGAGAAILTAGSRQVLAALSDVPGICAAPASVGQPPPGPGGRPGSRDGVVLDDVDRELDRWLIEPQSGLVTASPYPAPAISAPRPDPMAPPSVVRARILGALATYADLHAQVASDVLLLDARSALLFLARNQSGHLHPYAPVDAAGDELVRRNKTKPVWVRLDHVRRPVDLVKWWALGADVVVVPGDRHGWAASVQEVMQHAGVHGPGTCRTAELMKRV